MGPGSYRKRLFKWAVLAFSLGAGMVVGWFSLTQRPPSNTPSPPASKTWPDLDLGFPFGIRLSLKTEWQDGVRYLFRIAPMDTGRVGDFDRAADQILGSSGSSLPDIFTLHFLDAFDFELCKAEIGRAHLVLVSGYLGPNLGADGKADQCSQGEYETARKWTVTYRQNLIAGAKVRAEPSADVEEQKPGSQ